jgi:hypothetical protein
MLLLQEKIFLYFLRLRLARRIFGKIYFGFFLGWAAGYCFLFAGGIFKFYAKHN